MPIPLWKCKFCELNYSTHEVAEACEGLHRNLLQKKFGDITSAKIERIWNIGQARAKIDTTLDKIGREIA